MGCILLLGFYINDNNNGSSYDPEPPTIKNTAFENFSDIIQKNSNEVDESTKELLQPDTASYADTTIEQSKSYQNNSNSDIPIATNTDNVYMKETSALTRLTRESLRTLSAGTVIDAERLGNDFFQVGFYSEPIDEALTSRIMGISYKENTNIALKELRYVRLLHYSFDGQIHIGELIVNESIAEDIIDIFIELYEAAYPIERMLLVDEYDGDDNTSMSDNNTSAFNYRTMTSSDNLSKHALGLAVDMNPLYNPYVKGTKKDREVLPPNGTAYTDRSLDNPYYIKKDDICYKAFIKRGFTWGGEWKNSKDYQHFQKSKP
ncbi:hypothetical protein acsn021_44090 [Anaerocolumna cellulosilytica]|uniref:Peptidase M15C domain-containing protein n=2 Tax=Anaerocolumna cellulosilytica TaxID=433286 RepID=A0A6S6RBG1_9FIRM|nr:hypothetical protein acsn021_44090 [Anaerocolumna cellulosilytica]